MKKEKQQNHRAARVRRIIGWSLLGLIAALFYIIRTVPFGTYDFSAAPTTPLSADGRFSYSTPLDPASPWPKFRANSCRTGATPVRPVANDLTPWSYRTGKGIFSTPWWMATAMRISAQLIHIFINLHPMAPFCGNSRPAESSIPPPAG